MRDPAIAFIVKPFDEFDIDTLFKPLREAARAVDREIVVEIIDAGAAHQRGRHALLDAIEAGDIHDLFTPTMDGLLRDADYAGKLILAINLHDMKNPTRPFMTHKTEDKTRYNLAGVIAEVR